MIRFKCPACGAANSAPAGDAGTVVECTACQTDVEVPSSAPAPPRPKRRAAADEAVEIHPCPKCGTRLSVLAADIGTHVECPKCETEFVAARADGPPPPPLKQSSTRTPKLVERDEPEDEDDDRPKKRKAKKRKGKGSLRDDRYRTFGPHDGVLLLVLSLVGMALNVFSLCCLIGSAGGIVLGVYVIVKSSLSIREVKNGTMDPKGRVMLEIARGLAVLAILVAVARVVVRYALNDFITQDG